MSGMNFVRPFLRSPRLTGCGLAAVAWLAACAAGPAEPNGKQSQPAAGPSYKPVGSAGCAASNCHGRPDAPSLTGDPPPDCWRSSATHWRAVDPHTNAYALLE